MQTYIVRVALVAIAASEQEAKQGVENALYGASDIEVPDVAEIEVEAIG